MKNIEKYRNELLIAIEESSACIFAKKRGIPVDNCIKHKCALCKETLVDWLLEEYKPQIDWSKVPVDTPVITENGNRHFFKYENDLVYTFDDGTTSWTYRKQYGWVTPRDKTTVQLARPEDIKKYSI